MILCNSILFIDTNTKGQVLDLLPVSDDAWYQLGVSLDMLVKYCKIQYTFFYTFTNTP